MNAETYVSLISSPSRCEEWLRGLGVRDVQQGSKAIARIAELSLPQDLIALLIGCLDSSLKTLFNPDQALEMLAQFLAACRSPISVCSMFERDDAALPILLKLFVSGRGMADSLISDPESFDLIRMSGGKPVDRSEMVGEITSEILSFSSRQAIQLALRRFKQREILRIAFGEIHCQHSLETVTEQLSYLADAICEAGLIAAKSIVQEKRGLPRRFDNQIANVAIVGLGRLGGSDLDYSNQIDLLFLYDSDGKSDGRKVISNSEYFELVAAEFLQLMNEPTSSTPTYDINLSYRPNSTNASRVSTVDQALLYFRIRGRTWERQTYVRARHVAGDVKVGDDFVSQIRQWVFRRYLNRADLAEMRSLKRRIHAGMVENLPRSVRDRAAEIESVVTFLQILNGGNRDRLQDPNILQSIANLTDEGCVLPAEREILEESYRFFREIELRHQLMFEHNQTSHSSMPENMELLSRASGFVDIPGNSAVDQFEEAIASRSQKNQQIVNRLMEDAFANDTESTQEEDLVLDPKPSSEFIEQTLKRYGFCDAQKSYENLIDLATEHIPFLSTRRCRAFLSEISADLLTAVGDAPDPDETINNLARVSDSLGGKGVLWELFSFSPATLHLYVKLCAGSPYLSSILTSYPGMLDDLMDSLIRNQLPDQSKLRRMLADLNRTPDSAEANLHNFKSSQHLTAGVRDILGKGDITESMRFLSDVAECCLESLIQTTFDQLCEKYGNPQSADGINAELVVLALGKLGAREPNYHSNFDLLFVYDDDGNTKHRSSRTKKTTSNQHFFSELAQRVLKQTNHIGRFGRLFEVDACSNLIGHSGLLAIPMKRLVQWLQDSRTTISSRQLLTRARPIFGSQRFRTQASETFREALLCRRLTKEEVHAIFDDRIKREQNATPQNLKRGPGGTLDIEYLVETLHLTHGTFQSPQFSTGTVESLQYFGQAGILPESQVGRIVENYQFLRHVEARLRLMNTAARHDLPVASEQLHKLAYLLNTDSDEVCRECSTRMKENRSLFIQIVSPT